MLKPRRVLFVCTVLLCLSMLAIAQEARLPEIAARTIANLEQNQTVQSLSRAVRILQSNIEVSESVQSWVDALVSEATQLRDAGNTVEARRRLVQAIAVQRELPWDEKAEFAGSLLIETNKIVDPSVTLYGQVVQSYPATYTASDVLKLHLSLLSQGATRDLGTIEVSPRDLTEAPWGFSAHLDGVADGPYRLVAGVSDGGSLIRRLVTNIVIVQDMEAKRAEVEERLARLDGFESAKATVRYPFDYARVINTGGRELILRGFVEGGFNLRYDFSEGIENSLDLLEELEAGNDPLFRAKGVTHRHYEFTEAGEIMPYITFVPSQYDGTTALPLVVALHGAGNDENTFILNRGPAMQEQAEKHGFIVVSPLGYRERGGWGRVRSDRPSRMAELSEKDAMNVTELVAEEYGVDRSRIYLFGNSMGGSGTWHLGSKYADVWAAIAPCGSPSLGESFFPIEQLRDMPIIYTQGDQDNVERARTMISWAKEHGLDIPYHEVEDGTHVMAPLDGLATIFDFLAKHQKQ
jgi:predicted esterase